MKIPSQSQSPFRLVALAALMPLFAAVAMTIPQTAHADSGATVACMLPAQIQSVGGHATLGPRRSVQTTAEDCQQRGGEYTVAEQPAQTTTPAPDASVDTTPVRCLLPKQTRQLGSKTRYSTKSRVVHTTASDCQTKQGKVLKASGKSVR